MVKTGLEQANSLYENMKQLISKKETFRDAIEICRQLVLLYHKSESGNSIEDLLWNGLSFEQCAMSIEDQKCSTIGFNLWHTARFEDIFGNTILQDGEEVFYRNGWADKILKGFTSTGNALNLDERIELSKRIEYPMLLSYREQVKNNTLNILDKITYEDVFKPLDITRYDKAVERGSISLDENGKLNAFGINFDFRAALSKATNEFIIYRPFTFHHFEHLEQNFRIKETIGAESKL